MSETDILRLARAFRFAAEAHVEQRRKGERQEPYVNHLAEVADLVAGATGGRDPDLVVAALLHDTIEDTSVTRADLEATFGSRVAGIVAEVTDDRTRPKSERKRAQVQHASHISREAQILKLADKTSNIRGILKSPPQGWSDERKAEYVAWGREVVEICRAACPPLGVAFDEAARETLEQLGHGAAPTGDPQT